MPYSAGPHNVRETPTVGAGTTAQRTVAVPGSLWVNMDDPDNPIWERYDGTNWVDFHASAPTLPAWALAGNALAGGEKLGSTNSQDVVMYRNDVEKLRVAAALATVATALNYGAHLGVNSVKGSINFDNATNVCYIMQDGLLARSIQIPGTGGSGNWIFNNTGGAGIQIINSSLINNNVILLPGTNATTTPPRLAFSLSGFNVPARALAMLATGAADVNLVIGDGSLTYANNVGYNVRILSGTGGATGNNRGGHIFITPGPGGGTGTYGNVIIAESGGKVAIGTNSPSSSSAVQIDSTTGCFKPPRMTEAQRDAITAEAGDMIYNTTTNKHQGYDGSSWNDFY